MTSETDIAADWLRDAGRRAREAAAVLAQAPVEQRNSALTEAAGRIRAHAAAIGAANEADLAASARPIARVELKLSDPPRSTTALPDLRHSPAASAPTLGRLS